MRCVMSYEYELIVYLLDTTNNGKYAFIASQGIGQQTSLYSPFPSQVVFFVEDLEWPIRFTAYGVVKGRKLRF
jgi:hypothetical protein